MSNYKPQPKTNCIYRGGGVACDEYTKEPAYKEKGNYKLKHYNCCQKCGWNPRVEAMRETQLWRKSKC